MTFYTVLINPEWLKPLMYYYCVSTQQLWRLVYSTPAELKSFIFFYPDILQGYQPLRGRTDGPGDPRAPVQSVQPGAGYGFYLEVPRPHLASLDDPHARWPLP